MYFVFDFDINGLEGFDNDLSGYDEENDILYQYDHTGLYAGFSPISKSTNYETCLTKDFNINNTIISNKIISLLLSKLALIEDTESFYENLLTLEINEDEVDDQEVFIRKASEIFDEEFPFEFHNKKSFIKSTYLAFDKKIVPFGYFRDDKLVILSEDLHKHEHLKILKTDLIVLMKL